MRIMKFFLHLSKEEQRKRFIERIDSREQELEIQSGRHRRTKILEAISEGVRKMPECDQHRTGTLVRRARRRQTQCAADRLTHRLGDHQRAQIGIPQDRPKTAA
jgi:hypothetical protein